MNSQMKKCIWQALWEGEDFLCLLQVHHPQVFPHVGCSEAPPNPVLLWVCGGFIM